MLKTCDLGDGHVPREVDPHLRTAVSPCGFILVSLDIGSGLGSRSTAVSTNGTGRPEITPGQVEQVDKRPHLPGPARLHASPHPQPPSSQVVLPVNTDASPRS